MNGRNWLAIGAIAVNLALDARASFAADAPDPYAPLAPLIGEWDVGPGGIVRSGKPS